MSVIVGGRLKISLNEHPCLNLCRVSQGSNRQKSEFINFRLHMKT